MRHDRPGQSQYLVRDRTALYKYLLLFHHVDQHRVLVEREGMPDSSRAKQHGVEEVLICAVAISEGLASVEEEGYVDALFGASFLEPE